MTTYHGIVYARNLACDHASANTSTLEMWNDYGATCMVCDTTASRILWVLSDDTVKITEQNEDGTVSDMVVTGHLADAALEEARTAVQLARADVTIDDDFFKAKAQALVEACVEQGLTARLHWDRSPWACHVRLRDSVDETFDENTSGLFYMLEDGPGYRIEVPNTEGGWVWHAQLQIQESEHEDDLLDLGFTVIERTWLGDTPQDVARKIAHLVTMLDITKLGGMRL